VDYIAAARAAGCRRIDNAAIGCARTVQFRNTLGPWQGRYAYGKAERRAWHANANAG